MEECGARTAHWASSQWIGWIPKCALCGTSVSQIAMLIMVSMMQICTKWKLQSEALTRTHCQLYGTLQLRRRATERLRDTSNDTSLSNTATKGL